MVLIDRPIELGFPMHTRIVARYFAGEVNVNIIRQLTLMPSLHSNITRLYAFSFLQKTLFPMAIITLFWKDRIGLSLTQILLLQGIFSIAMVVMEYPSGYVSDRLGYRVALTMASLLGMVGWGIYTVAGSFGQVLAAEILLGISLSFISGSDSALLYETLKAEGQEQYYARHEGRMNGYAQAGEAMGALFAGVLYATAPLLPFILQVGVWFLALLLTRTMVEPARDSAPRPATWQRRCGPARYAFVENRRLRATILLNAVLGIASFYPVWLIQPYMQHAGVPLAWFGPVWAGANLTVAFFALASHRVTGHPGGPADGDAVHGPDRGGVFRAGPDRRDMGISLLLPADRHEGVARADDAPPRPDGKPVGQPGGDPVAPVALLPAAVRLHRPPGRDAGRRRRGPADLSPARYAFLLVLPPLAWLFFRNLPREKRTG